MQVIEPYAKMQSPLDGYAPSDFNYPDDRPMMDGKFNILDGTAMLRRIEYATRVSHRSEDAITSNSYIRLLRSVVFEHGDLSVIEHEKVTVEAVVDRGITHEWVRHRLFSYTQESTRFVNYKKKGGEAKFIKPTFGQGPAVNEIWAVHMEATEKAYMQLIDNGIAPQLARSVFPNSLAAKIIVTGNLRSWRHFFIMRTSKETHPQMKQVTLPLLQEFKATIPVIFEDIVPEQRQADMMRLLR